jgi:hypothetical protein
MRKLFLALVILLFPAAAEADYMNLGQPYPITWTRISGTIATGGTSQQLLAANPGRRALLIENPCNATEDLYVEPTSSAASTTLSIDVPACGNITFGIGVVSQGVVNIIGATTSHAFIAYEGN